MQWAPMTWRSLNPALREPLPGQRRTSVLGGVDARPQRTSQNLEALARVCLRIKQLARAFLGTRILNQPGAVLTLHHLELEPLTQDLT